MILMTPMISIITDNGNGNDTNGDNGVIDDIGDDLDDTGDSIGEDIDDALMTQQMITDKLG